MSSIRGLSVRCARTLAVVAAVVLSFLEPWSEVFAQETTGAIEGTILAPDGTPLAGVEVAAKKPSPRVERIGITNRDGGFRITALPLGKYEIAVRDPRFEPSTIDQVVVRLGRTTGVPAVRLAPLGSLVERVEVVGKAPPIDPASTSTGGNISAALFDNLPLQRDYQSIAMLLPNVSTSYLGDGINFNGATGEENRYFVDGIDMTDPSRGLGGTVLPPDFIQEVELKTGGYEAEYRSALGGMVNVVTPTGGNRLAGKFIGYWTSHVVSTDSRQSPLQLQQKDFAQHDVGFSLSGPLAKDRAWFFLAYDPAYQSVETEVPGVGYFEDSSTAHRFAGKIDWRVNGSNSLGLTVVGDPMERDAVGELPGSVGMNPVSFLNPDPYLRSIERGGVGISVRGTHVLGPRVLLETSLSNLWRKDRNLPATDRGRNEVLFIDAATGVWSGGSQGESGYRNSQMTAGVKAIWALARHEIKFGAEYRDNGLRLDGDSNHYENVYRYSDTYYTRFTAQGEGSVGNRIPSLFVQDSWRVDQRLVLNYGLRWAREGFVAPSGDVVQRLDDEWQPRMGFVYQPGRIGSQRIYGSAARYYQEVASIALQNYEMGGVSWELCTYDHDPRLDSTGGDCFGYLSPVQPEVKGLRGDYTDEYSLGYQRQFGARHRAGVRAIYRTLGDTIDDALVTATGIFVWGNPGRGELAADYPRASRVYRALEFTIEGQPSTRSGYLASYVLSENRGNYMGLYNTDYGQTTPNYGSFDFPEWMVNSDGLLPNDRTHVFKASGFYRFASGLNIGSSGLWQSGTPLNEFGGDAHGWPFALLRPRGTAGRTPSIFDLGLRLDYTFLRKSTGRWKPRLILDVYHLFSGRKPVDYDQTHYFNRDAEGNQANPNPTYGMVKQYYPPAAARLGLEVTF